MTEATQDQPATESLPDRIASMFDPGQPEEYEPQAEPEVEGDEPEAEDAAPEPDVVEVEIDGETFALPKKAAEAAMRHADYTRKTQELAEQRRQVEFAQKALETAKIEREFHESTATELQQIQMVENHLSQLQNIDIRLLSTDEKLDHIVAMQQAERMLSSLKGSVDKKRSEFTDKQRAALDKLKDEAKAALSKQFPGLTDDTLAQVDSFAKSLGYTDQDLGLFRVDPRATAVLIKAMKFDQLQSKATPIAKTPVIKPGSSNPMPQQVRDKLNFRKAMAKATDSQSKAKLIEQRLGNMF
jgi:hypothetical protein